MKAINIILDNTDSQNPIFIEIEDDEGKSITIGDWEPLSSTAITMATGKSYHKIRITLQEFAEK